MGEINQVYKIIEGVHRYGGEGYHSTGKQCINNLFSICRAMQSRMIRHSNLFIKTITLTRFAKLPILNPENTSTEANRMVPELSAT